MTGSNIGGCEHFNVKCLCSNSGFLSDIACCIQNACSSEEATAAVNYAKHICTDAGATVSEILCNHSTSSGTVASTAVAAPASSTAAAAVRAAASRSSSVAALLGAVTAMLVTS